MKRYLLLILIFLTAGSPRAQNVTTELSAGNHSLLYQHIFSKKPGKNSCFGLLHVANIHTWYKTGMGKTGAKVEIMNQAYLSIDIKRPVTIFAGLFYSNATGLRGTTAFQLVKKGSDWLLILTPRIDIMNKGSRELFAQWEYWPKLNDQVKLYSRAQIMLNRGPSHFNRGYQRLRLGVDIKNTQVGLAYNFDDYGAAGISRSNTGVFIRRQFL